MVIFNPVSISMIVRQDQSQLSGLEPIIASIHPFPVIRREKLMDYLSPFKPYWMTPGYRNGHSNKRSEPNIFSMYGRWLHKIMIYQMQREKPSLY